jgi:acyl carrier protein
MAFENKASVQETVKAFLIEQLCSDPVPDISPTADLLKEGIVDSLNLLRLVDYLEAQYQIRIRNRDLVAENFCSLAAIEALVEQTRRRRRDELSRSQAAG